MDETCSLEIPKIVMIKLGMSWIHKIYLESSLFLHRHKVNDAGKDWGWEGMETTEVEMVGWHHWLNEHEFG